MFRLVDSAKLFPQRTITGSTVGPMVDTEVVIEKGCRVYISALEAGEIARHFGMLGVDAARQKDAHIAALEGELAEARATLARIRGDVAAAV